MCLKLTRVLFSPPSPHSMFSTFLSIVATFSSNHVVLGVHLARALPRWSHVGVPLLFGGASFFPQRIQATCLPWNLCSSIIWRKFITFNPAFSCCEDRSDWSYQLSPFFVEVNPGRQFWDLFHKASSRTPVGLNPYCP